MSEPIANLLTQAARARREHRLDDAHRDLAEAVAAARSGSPTELAAALKALGQVERDMQHLDVALQHYQEAADLYRATNHPMLLAHTVRHVADIQRNAGHTALAEAGYREALAIYRANPSTTPLDLANAIRGLAILKSGSGAADEAKALWEEAHDLYASVGVQAGVAECTHRLDLLADTDSQPA